MKMTFCTIALALAVSLCGCSASEKTQMNELGKDSSNSLKTLGKDVDKVGQAIKSSTKDIGKDNSKSDQDTTKNDTTKNDKDTAEGDKGSTQYNDLKKDASNAINELGKEGDKAEHAMAGTIKDLGKNMDKTRKN
jgi:hypothetical protein